MGIVDARLRSASSRKYQKKCNMSYSRERFLDEENLNDDLGWWKTNPVTPIRDYFPKYEPCPFCKNKNNFAIVEKIDYDIFNCKHTQYKVMCNSCNSMFVPRKTEYRARKAYNRLAGAVRVCKEHDLMKEINL